jgi:hypothetical protein
MDRVRNEQAMHAARAGTWRRSSCWNFWSGVGCFALWWLRYHIGTVLLAAQDAQRRRQAAREAPPGDSRAPL